MTTEAEPTTDIVAAARGVNGQVRLQGDWVVIARRGALARLGHGPGDRRLPLSSISSVRLRPPTVFSRGFVQLTVAGDSRPAHVRPRDAVRDDNAVVFKKSQLADFEAFRSAVESRMGQQATQGTSPADRIRQLAKLRDSGLITAAEFEAKKAGLLDRM